MRLMKIFPLKDFSMSKETSVFKNLSVEQFCVPVFQVVIDMQVSSSVNKQIFPFLN